jgi:hypothetical protein
VSLGRLGAIDPALAAAFRALAFLAFGVLFKETMASASDAVGGAHRATAAAAMETDTTSAEASRRRGSDEEHVDDHLVSVDVTCSREKKPPKKVHSRLLSYRRLPVTTPPFT